MKKDVWLGIAFVTALVGWLLNAINGNLGGVALIVFFVALGGWLVTKAE